MGRPQAKVLTEDQKPIVAAYVRRYPHLAGLAKLAETVPQSAKALGDAISRVKYPEGLTGIQCYESSKIGMA